MDDHVFPMSWYPGTTPANEEKWKITSAHSRHTGLPAIFIPTCAHALKLAPPTPSTGGADVRWRIARSGPAQAVGAI
jgi:hypothetical protein